jgi:hypothetical protein
LSTTASLDSRSQGGSPHWMQRPSSAISLNMKRMSVVVNHTVECPPDGGNDVVVRRFGRIFNIASSLSNISARLCFRVKLSVENHKMQLLTLHADAWAREGSEFASGDRVDGMLDGAWARIVNFGTPSRNGWQIMRISPDNTQPVGPTTTRALRMRLRRCGRPCRDSLKHVKWQKRWIRT